MPTTKCFLDTTTNLKKPLLGMLNQFLPHKFIEGLDYEVGQRWKIRLFRLMHELNQAILRIQQIRHDTQCVTHPLDIMATLYNDNVPIPWLPTALKVPLYRQAKFMDTSNATYQMTRFVEATAGRPYFCIGGFLYVPFKPNHLYKTESYFVWRFVAYSSLSHGIHWRLMSLEHYKLMLAFPHLGLPNMDAHNNVHVYAHSLEDVDIIPNKLAVSEQRLREILAN